MVVLVGSQLFALTIYTGNEGNDSTDNDDVVDTPSEGEKTNNNVGRYIGLIEHGVVCRRPHRHFYRFSLPSSYP